MAQEAQGGTTTTDSLRGRFMGADFIDLKTAPEGQGFMITLPDNHTPLFGIVRDNERPIVEMRQNALGAAISRWLQVPGNPSGPLTDFDLRGIEEYYFSTIKGEGAHTFAPTHLRPGVTAHFMQLDANNEVLNHGNNAEGQMGVNIEKIGVLALQWALPLKEGTLAHFGPHADMFRHLVKETA